MVIKLHLHSTGVKSEEDVEFPIASPASVMYLLEVLLIRHWSRRCHFRAGLDGVTGFFRRFAQINTEQPERAAMGCLMVNSVVELGKSDPGVTDRAEWYRNRVRGAFRSALQKAVQQGDVSGAIEGRVDLSYMMLMGLYVSVKGGATLDEIIRLSEVAIGVAESWRLPDDRDSAS